MPFYLPRISLVILLLMCNSEVFAQNYWDNWERESIDSFYGKQELPYGTLNANGNPMLQNVVYVPTTLEKGNYEVSIRDEAGDIYHISGTNIYLTFSTYFGYAAYGTEGVLVVNNYGGGYFYKNPR